eukprot:TRINITY_DN3802_c1_g1_i1.p1 TRINITY_DN3802_c1_g1~~TRINITY_DN3802_c1_g1_i1.p1  ORF type:complete len:794 (-),score=135.76 TRINITY_DN3802_c1_g1_i1:112-2493(-)
MTTAFASLAVYYSRCGKERIWSSKVCSDGLVDGPEEAIRILKAFADANSVSASSVTLKVLPPRPGGPQVDMKPVSGQSLISFLERRCREDHGIFQLRASFDSPSSKAFVQVRVAFPGTATLSAAANIGSSSEAQQPPMIIEQFECEASSDVPTLKRLIEARTKFPAAYVVLLLGFRRLHDELRMSLVADAAEANGAPLHLHLAASGALAFLRREGQGHREQIGSNTLTLRLPSDVLGTRERPMAFDPSQCLSNLRWSVQAVSGIAPSRMELKLKLPGMEARELFAEDESLTLEELGFAERCILQVGLVEADKQIDLDMPIDIPAAGSARDLYDNAAVKLGIGDSSRLALFAGGELVLRDAHLSRAPIADGVIISAYIAWPLQLSVSVLSRQSLLSAEALTAFGGSSSSTTGVTTGDSAAVTTSSLPVGAAGVAEGSLTSTVAVTSYDTVSEVRERLVAACSAAAKSEAALQLQGSLAFVLQRRLWTEQGHECSSLSALERTLGHFTPCAEGARLSRLGIADGSGHLLFVPRRQLHVEVEVQCDGEVQGLRKLRVSGTIRLSELSQILQKSLCDRRLPDSSITDFSNCTWSLRESDSTAPGAEVSCSSTKSPAKKPEEKAPLSGVAEIVSKVKRKSLGMRSGEASAEKRRRLGARELDNSEFISDLHARHPAADQELAKDFICPISHEVMCDPVVVNGSGNSYDRKSIEMYFQKCKGRYRDPLSNVELRKADRKLIQNNSLRSQIDEAKRSQVDLRLTAWLIRSDQRRSNGFGPGDASMASNLSWCSWLLSRNS